MTWKATASVLGIAAIIGVAPAAAQGELHLFNWGNYTPPELLEKFEQEHGISVTVTDFDSNDTALAKIRAGGHGFDMVVPSGHIIPVWISEGLLLESRPDQMENFSNVAERWVNVPFDEGRRYTVPWQWGTTGVAVNKSVYDGDPNTSAIWLDPPDELKGRVNVVPEMSDAITLATYYVGGEQCTDDMDVMRQVRDKLLEAKQHWLSMDYGMVEKLAGGDVAASLLWNGATFRARLQNPDIVYGYPKEGYSIWMDNLAILADARNVENAKLFMNFVMDPENIAMVSAFARYANGIEGSAAYMPDDMKDAPEIHVPEELQDAGRFSMTCPPEVNELQTAIWTELMR
jgi:spermidine/putrescine transport system substrate-binding protein